MAGAATGAGLGLGLIWIPDDKAVWAVAEVTEAKKGKSVKVLTKDGKEKKVDGPMTAYDSVTPQDLSRECDNLLDLESFSEGLILHHVKERFARGTIYTAVGAILVAVNPYRTLDIYGEGVMLQIWEQRLAEAKGANAAASTLTPHVFSVGATALHSMRDSGASQAVLISGESGAGKTETTKKILQFLSSVGMYAANGKSGPIPPAGAAVESSIADQILGTNPILESFGNAKTLKNNNSSRFGKYMEISFTAAPTYAICGTSIRTYLLEKNRVIAQGPNERNYHIFYMLLAGVSKDFLQEFTLDSGRDPAEWAYLNASGCVKVSGRSEKQEYVDLISAFGALKFPDDTVKSILQVLAAILHIGNIHFKAEDDGSIVENREAVVIVAELLGIEHANTLEECFCSKEIVVNKERTLAKLDVSKAQEQRDALARFLYGAVFDILVLQINSTLGSNIDAMSTSTANIGILDIFGFEVFVVNSFEQLCINYCNERLQTFFNEVIFEKEIEIYKKENIDLADITFVDNLGCVKIIDGAKGAGIFSLLDEECIVPQGNDTKLLSKMNSAFGDEKQTKTYSAYFATGSRKSPNDFVVKHFAGDVTYNITNFCEKNKDTLNAATLATVASSSLDLMKQVIHVSGGDEDADSHASVSPGKRSSKSGKVTISHKFKNSLDSLMTSLHTKQPSFVRCLKPNEQAKPDKFDCPLLLSQMKYSGLFEAIKIRKSGFAVRIDIKAFYHRYRSLIPIRRWADAGIDRSKPGKATDKDKKKSEQKGDQGDHRSSEEDSKYYRSQTKLLLKALENVFSGPDALIPADEQKDASELLCNTKGKAKNWVLGGTLVFLRTTHSQNILNKRLNGVIFPSAVGLIQKQVKVWLKSGAEQRLIDAAKRAEATDLFLAERENDDMEDEDAISQSENLAFRQGRDKVKRQAEAKKRAIEEEARRVLAKRIRAVVRIQSFIRGKHGHRVGHTYMCEIRFERALLQRDEGALYVAMKKTEALGVKSKALARYKKSASSVILDVLSEAHVVSQLQDAIRSDSDYLLAEAVAAAEASRMGFLPQVKTARQLLVAHQELKTGLAWLERELELATTVPRLLQSVDYIRRLIQEASTKSLHNEPVCQEALFRIGKMRNLLSIRDEMRFACETASPSAMKAAMASRAKLLPIFGDSIFQEELAAIGNMLRMLSVVSQLGSIEDGEEEGDGASGAADSETEPESVDGDGDGDGGNDGADESKDDGDDAHGFAIDGSRENNGTASQLPKGAPKPPAPATGRGSKKAADEDVEARALKAARALKRKKHIEHKAEKEHIRLLERANTVTDVNLPAWLRELLLTKKKSQSQSTAEQIQAFSSVCKKINRLCPNKRILRQYLRVFKWTVAFCTWMPDHPKHDREKHPFARTVIGSGAAQGEFAPPPPEVDFEQNEFDVEHDTVAGATSAFSKMTIAKKSKIPPPPPPTARAAAGNAVNPIDPKTGKDKYGRSASKLSAAVSGLGGARGGGAGHAFAPPTYKETHSRISLAEGFGTASSKKRGLDASIASHRSALRESEKPGYMAGKSGRRLKSDMARAAAIKSGKDTHTRVGATADEIIQDAISALGSVESNSKSRHGTAWL